MSDYEGHVKYADGSVVSLQCFEGRHDDCPDPMCQDPDGPETSPLDGYNCECTGEGTGTGDALDRIAAELNGWTDDSGDSGDILGAVVRIVRDTGREIKDSNFGETQ